MNVPGVWVSLRRVAKRQEAVVHERTWGMGFSATRSAASRSGST